MRQYEKLGCILPYMFFRRKRMVELLNVLFGFQFCKNAVFHMNLTYEIYRNYGDNMISFRMHTSLENSYLFVSLTLLTLS